MSGRTGDGELRPGSPTRRPETARRRADAEPADEPPDAVELTAIERHLASLPVHSGASVSDLRELGMVVVDSPSSAIGLDYGAVIRWRAGDAAGFVAAFEARQRARGVWPSLLVSEGLTAPDDLERTLERGGWSVLGSERVFWTRRPAVVPHLDPDLRLEAATPASAAEHEALERSVFGLPPRAGPERVEGLRRGLERGDLRAYLVRLRTEVVAVARLSLAETTAGLYGVGVAAEQRRQGLGTLVTTVATRAGLASGRRLVWLSVEEGNDGARMLYEGLGFRPAFAWRRWLAPPTG